MNLTLRSEPCLIFSVMMPAYSDAPFTAETVHTALDQQSTGLN